IAALLVGGYFGSWVPGDAVPGLTLEAASLRRAGATLGSGAIVALPAGSCGLVETARVVGYLADESAGQCGPCVHGHAAIAGARPCAAGEGGVSVRIQVDPIACEAHGLCAELLPELIQLDDWGDPILAAEPVAPGLLDHARRAVDACPRVALAIEDEAVDHR